MAKKHLTADQQGRIAEKIMDWGNLIFAGLILGQALSEKPFDFQMAAIGGSGIIIAYALAIALMKGGVK